MPKRSGHDMSPNASAPRLHSWTLDRVGSFLDDHLGDSVNLDDLARLASVSRFHFARCFRSSTGESPMAFLRRLRIERAKQLLESGDQPISDIALELGFYDQSHFSRHFRRIVGTTPGRYARQGQLSPAAAGRQSTSVKSGAQA